MFFVFPGFSFLLFWLLKGQLIYEIIPSEWFRDRETKQYSSPSPGNIKCAYMVFNPLEDASGHVEFFLSVGLEK